MASIQSYSVYKYARTFLSPLLRRPGVLGYLYALLRPVAAAREVLTATTYPDAERRTRYNAQVLRFERILNTTFGTTTIYIDESGVATHTYVYNEAELQPLFLYNEAETLDPDAGTGAVFLYNALEFIPLFDFTVHVPQALYDTQLARVRAVVKKYSLAGITFTVVPF